MRIGFARVSTAEGSPSLDRATHACKGNRVAATGMGDACYGV